MGRRSEHVHPGIRRRRAPALLAVLAASCAACTSTAAPAWSVGSRARGAHRHYPCSKPNSAHVPCYFSTPSANIRCEWTPASDSVACELLATRRAYRLGRQGRARAVKLRLSRRGETLPSSHFQLVFPQKLSCEDTSTTMTCNQDEGFGFFKLGPGLARSG